MDELGPEAAARQLAEIEARQRAAIRRVLVPGWYWWLVGVGMVALGLAVDTQPAPVIAVAAVGFALAVAAVSAFAIAGGLTGARARGELLGPEGAAAIVLLDLAIVGGSIAVAFAAQAARFAYPGTLGTAIGAAVMVTGGPILMARLGRVMESRHRA